VHSDPNIGRGLYGVAKVWHQLRRENIVAARCTIERLMRLAGLQGVRRGKQFVTTKSDPSAVRPPDLVERDFTAARPNQLWIVDFTYVATCSGMVFTAFVTPGSCGLLTGPKGGVITTATLRDATGWDDLVERLGHGSLVRHGLRHTAMTWMADSGVSLYVLQRVAGHQDPAVTARYLHPDTRALLEAGTAFSAWWGQSGDKRTDVPQRPGEASIRESGV